MHRGHPHAADYTPAAAELFLRAADRQDRRELRAHALAINAGMAGGDHLPAFLRSLE